MKNCISCENEIPAGRLKALPSTQTCTDCSTTGRVGGHTVISGKNTYSELEILPWETAAILNSLQSRRGYGVSKGVKFRFDSRKN